MNYSSLDDVFPDKPWPKKSHGIAKTEQKRDAVQEGRIFADPRKRGEASVAAMKKGIDDLSKTLPIVTDDDESNFQPEKIVSREHFGITKTSETKPFYRTDDGTNFAYAPPSFQQDAHELRMERLYRLLDQQTGSETPGTQDMLLYIFTGVFFIFTFDTFVNLGKLVR
uniref:Uncharacterized protein n=1 Tax=viral metagenome TaxID=1070528 RepID=A0A6C0JHZ3_9ZZZZ